MITVWGRKTSSNVQALMWCIDELGLDYQRYDVGHKYRGTETDFFYSLNPNRTIPVIKDGDNPPLWETGAILRYLSGQYAPDDFWPTDALARAEVDKWAEWSKINIAMAFTAPIFWAVVRTAAQQRDWQLISQAVSALEAKFTLAEHKLKVDRFIAGDKFTLADIQFGHILYRYFEIDIQRSELPYLRDYYQRLLERPAYQQHVAIRYDELRSVD